MVSHFPGVPSHTTHWYISPCSLATPPHTFGKIWCAPQADDFSRCHVQYCITTYLQQGVFIRNTPGPPRGSSSTCPSAFTDRTFEPIQLSFDTSDMGE